jgi:predicted nucleotidyltransferase
MLNLYAQVVKKETKQALSDSEIASVYYHDIFDYPLNLNELIKWLPKDPSFCPRGLNVVSKNGYYFLEGREGLIYKRILKSRISEKKLEIAKKAARIIGYLPNIKMIGVTGSLSMKNSNEDGDIDLIIVAKSGNLWTARIMVYMLTKLFGIKTRVQGDKNQKDKLCLNIWMDEGDLKWKVNDRNIYTAHEIAQIVPLVNKDNTFEKFVWENKWICQFWPKAIAVKEIQKKSKNRKTITRGIVEKFAYWLQYSYMKGNITREVVTPTRALFHPHDWAGVVLNRLES